MESMTDCAFSWPISERQVSLRIVSLRKVRKKGFERRRYGKGTRTLVVIEDISFMVATCIVSFSDAHGVVCEINIAVIAFPISIAYYSRVLSWGDLQKSASQVSS